MGFKEPLVFVILLLSALDLTESRCSRSKHVQEGASLRPKRDTADYVKGANETEDLAKALSSDDMSLDYGFSECDGPDTWAEKFPACGGNSQSPININLTASIHVEGKYHLHMENYHEKPKYMTLRNTGKTVVIEGKWKHGERPYITGGTLKGKYIFQEIHFHWSASKYEPNQHLINGKSYALEMDIMHYKKKYGSYGNALNYNDGLAAIGYVFKITEKDNYIIQKIVDALPNVLNPSSTTFNLKPFRLTKLAPKFYKHFATYRGSQIRPPCNEIATRIVYLKPLTLSCIQVDAFRQINGAKGSPLVRNFRPAQNLNQRKVFVVS